jgi:hypothetical protein
MKLSELSQTATESPPIKDEIAALEQQISYRRERLKSRSYLLEYRLRKRLTSPAVLLAAVAGGFLGERYLRHKQSAPSKPQVQAPKEEGLIEKGLKMVTLIQGIMASYPVMLLRKYLAEKNQQMPPQSLQQEMQETAERHYH